MNEIEIFKNEEFGEVRTTTIDGEPYFVGKDVAKILGYAKPLNALATHIDKDDSLKQGLIDNLGRNQDTIFINESGLYSLILSSKLPNAKKFKHWVTAEVLPSIRKHGAYMTSETIEKALTSPDFLIQLATQLKKEKIAREKAEQKIIEQEPFVNFANKVSDSSNLIDMGKMAKLLKDEHINIGRNRLFKWLREEGILMSNNIPYQRYINGGYFKVIESVYHTPYETKTQQTTMITGRGQIYITERLRREYK